MKIIAMDISGNFGREGTGTTGICVMVDGEPIELTHISANDYETEVEYWSAHETYIQQEKPNHLIMEGYRLYNHKGKEAKMQANSDLQTPQLLGVLKVVAHRLGIPVTVQYASQVKSRWQETILVHLGHLEVKGGKHYFKGKRTVTHHRDALKHALHWWRYTHERKEDNL